MTTTPVTASVQDNLSTVVAKLIGQKNETTTEANFNSASTNAKLNYLKSEMANLKTKVEISGGVPRCIEAGYVSPDSFRTFTGPGYLLVEGTGTLITLDGITLNNGLLWQTYDMVTRLDFRESATIDGNDCGRHTKYAYYKY